MEALGKSYAAGDYAVGREKIREYAAAVGETDPLHHDLERPRGRPATPTSSRRRCSPWSTPAGPVAPALFDPEVGIDFARMVHGGQEFVWGPLVVAGDEITTVATFTEHRESAGCAFFELRDRLARTSAGRRSAPATGRTSCGVPA